MKKYTVLIGTDDGSLMQADAIECQSKLWIVPVWLDTPDQGWTAPNRIIRFDNRRYQDTRTMQNRRADFVLNEPIPKALLELKTPAQPIVGFDYVELPEIRLALP